MENLNNLRDDKRPSERDVEMRKLDIKERSRRDFKLKCLENKNRIIGIILSLLTIISLFNFGLFKTLGIWIIMFIGYGIGSYYDRDINFLRFMNKIINSFR